MRRNLNLVQLQFIRLFIISSTRKNKNKRTERDGNGSKIVNVDGNVETTEIIEGGDEQTSTDSKKQPLSGTT